MVAHPQVAKLAALLALVLLSWVGSAQTKPTRAAYPRVIALPQGPLTRIPSPNRKWTLIFEFSDVNKPRKLWIQRKGSGERTLVRDFDRSLDVSWSPDSQHFFVNDASGSTDTLCYVYGPETLRPMNVLELLTSASRRASNFEADHFYVEAKHWVGSDELLVTVMGYLSSTPPKPGFSGTYRINLNGSVRTIREGYWR